MNVSGVYLQKSVLSSYLAFGPLVVLVFLLLCIPSAFAQFSGEAVTIGVANSNDTVDMAIYNGNGLALAQRGADGDEGQVQLFINDEGILKPTITLSAGPMFTTQAMRVADLNKDGYDDIVLSSLLELACFLSTGPDSFAAPVITPMTTPGAFYSRIDLVDLNGDKLEDLIVAEPMDTETLEPKLLKFMLYAGDGTFVDAKKDFDLIAGTKLNSYSIMKDPSDPTKTLIAIVTHNKGETLSLIKLLVLDAGLNITEHNFPLAIGIRRVILGVLNGATMLFGEPSLHTSTAIGVKKNLAYFAYTSPGVANEEDFIQINGQTYLVRPSHTNELHELRPFNTTNGTFDTVQYTFQECDPEVSALECTEMGTKYVRVADMNGDGKDDVVSLMLNAGDDFARVAINYY